jgi:maltooligosyltrehalose trehalohydrolase
MAPTCGAWPEDGCVRFRVWAPGARHCEVVVDGRGAPGLLERAADGHFEGRVSGVEAGARYAFRLDGNGPYPDPCSRFQPDGPHGPSMVVDPAAFAWQDTAWRGIGMRGQVFYELHVGTFTAEGTFDAAARELPELARLGITCVEVMPVADFPGRWNWGYDGVNLYAPYHGYGDCEAFKRFVDAAHRHGLAVILDVVYNHLGPDGNYLKCFSPAYFTDRYANEWGEAINFDGPDAGPVREYFVGNACYWVREFHLDGLRLDATQSIHDAGPRHVLAELVTAARAAAAPRGIILVAENEPQASRHLLPQEQGGYGLDAMWNDDFHHSARVALTGRHEGYFHDHRGRAQEFVAAAKRGFLFQGQHYHWQKKPRGEPVTTQPAWAFVHFLQNHDQVANTLHGERVCRLASPGRLRAMVALTLLGPETPLIFMGEEMNASQPFTFFADHRAELARQVHGGRREFVAQFESFATPAAQARVQDPAAAATFQACKLDFAERETHTATYALYRDLLALRREDPVIARQDRFALDGTVLADGAFALRWFDAEHGDRLLVVNLGAQVDLAPAPEPLLAPPYRGRWTLAWSSDEPRYGGLGAIAPCGAAGWTLPGDSASLLRAARTDV